MLFTDPHTNVTIVRPQDRGRISPGGSPVSFELLSPDLQRKIEMILMRLEPGARAPWACMRARNPRSSSMVA